MRVSFLPEAEAEHLKQVAYYESQQSGLGARYLAAVNAALEYICEGPQRFPIAKPPSLRRFALKHFPFTIFSVKCRAKSSSLRLQRIVGAPVTGAADSKAL